MYFLLYILHPTEIVTGIAIVYANTPQNKDTLQYLVKVVEGKGEVRSSVWGRELKGDSQHQSQVLGTPVVPLDCGTEMSLVHLLLVTYYWQMRGEILQFHVK